MQRIVLLFPYFGPLPAQYGIWRVSALHNPSIDFMFFTDTDVEVAENIIVHKMQFTDFQKLVYKAFDFPVVIDRPYKLCEYKQAYGHILHEYIRNYDFWGFGDIDLVYGDIRAFLTDDVLNHKFILGWGHLTLLHNDEDTNTFFMKKTDGYQYYQDAFSTSMITFFDEFGHKGCSDKWRDTRPEDCWLEEPFDNVSKPKQSYHFNSLNHPKWTQIVFEHIGNKLFVLRFCNGQLKKRETLYAHFQHRSFMKDKITDYAHFLVTPSSMINFPKHLTTLQLKYYCRQHRLITLYYQWKDLIIWKLGYSKQR